MSRLDPPRAASAGVPSPLSPSVLRMAGPLVISFWMRAVVTLVDTIFAAVLGDHAVAAIGLTVPLEFLMIAAWVGTSTGLTACLSRAVGARAAARFEQYKTVARRLILGLTPFFALAGAAVWFVAPRLGLEPATASAFAVYGTVLVVGSSITTFWSILPDSVVKAYQDTRSTMWAGITSNLLNVGLNSLFLFVFGWGLFGIALSTVLSRLGGLIYAISRARAHEMRAALTPAADHALDPAPYRSVLRLAIPASLTFGLMATESGLINALLARAPFATEAIAAYSIYYRLVLFSMQPVIATAVAMLPFASRLIGVGDCAGIRRGLRQASRACLTYAIVVVGPVMYLSAPWIAGALADAALTVEYATFALRSVAVACAISIPFLLCRPVFEALGEGRPGLVMALVRYALLTAPLGWIGLTFAASLGYPAMYGLIVGTLIAGAVTSAIFALWLRRALTAFDRATV